MLTTLLVSTSTKVLGAFASSKKSTKSLTSVVSGLTNSSGVVPPTPAAGMHMRSGTVMEKKMTNDDSDSIEMQVDEG